MSTTNADSEADSTDTNLSKLREMALRGDNYRESIDFTYYGEEGEIYVRPLNDTEFLPIAGFLEERLDIDAEEARDQLESEKQDGSIDPSEFDEEFVEIMQKAAVMGIDTTQGIAEGEDQEGLENIVGMLQGGKSLVIAQRVLKLSSDADGAKKFQRGGSGE